jgi:hypothetical protein
MSKRPSPRKPSRKSCGPKDTALALPFVKLNEGVAGKRLDYWAPPAIEGEEGLAPEFRGGLYARLAVAHMTRHPDEHPILLDIIGCMVAKGRFWSKFDDDDVRTEDQDLVAIGFVGALATMLGWADSAGLVRRQALSHAAHLETCVEMSHDKGLKRSAVAAAEALRAFALSTDDAQSNSTRDTKETANG